jgi:alanine racemase
MLNTDIPKSLILTDSRFLSKPSETLFVAIKGNQHDGHLFIPELISKGVTEFLISDEWAAANPEILKKATFITARNPVTALQKIARKHREKFSIPVVGITGSNGKTIVKEWLNTILVGHFQIVKSPRSYNSQIGVPLSVWQINENHTLGIFEAGISQPAEMQALQQIIQPELGIFTNIGSAHSQGFRSQKQKITEKLRLFRNSKLLIYSNDYIDLDEEIRIFLKAVNPGLELIAWSRKGKGSVQIEVEPQKDYSLIRIYWNGEDFRIRFPFSDEASIENGIHCFFAAYKLLSGIYPEDQILEHIQRGIDLLKPVPMRLELKEGINNCYLIDDSYNNDFGGLSMALNFMNQHHANRKKTVILSDLLQSGLPKNELYCKINELLEGASVDNLIGIGPDFEKYQNNFDTIITYLSVAEFLENHKLSSFSNELILIKGARDFGFEKIVEQLTNKVHGTVFEINLDAITHNLNFYRSLIPQKTKMMVMVKASAYGNGSTEIASLLQYHRVDYLSVAYADEGVELRRDGIDLPIMVLNIQPESFRKIIDYNLEPELYSIPILKSFLTFLENEEIKKPVRVHLKIDTGMKRLGFYKEDIAELKTILANQSKIKVASIFSHLAAADSKQHTDFTHEQINTFKAVSNDIISGLKEQPLRHIANTSGIIRFPEAAFDMVRLGIGLYGVEATGTNQEALETVGVLKTTISQIKAVKKGETVGYGRVGVADKDMQIATIAIGYADGFDRHLSNGKGVVWINGKLCPTIGNVCMDMTMINITDVDAREGDAVEIFGKNLPIFDIAKRLDTIPYEILTKIGNRVKRVFFKE